MFILNSTAVVRLYLQHYTARVDMHTLSKYGSGWSSIIIAAGGNLENVLYSIRHTEKAWFIKSLICPLAWSQYLTYIYVSIKELKIISVQ